MRVIKPSNKVGFLCAKKKEDCKLMYMIMITVSYFEEYVQVQCNITKDFKK